MTETMTLPPHVWQLIRPKEHCLAFLRNGVRWDGRGLLERRPLSVRKHALSLEEHPYVIGSAQVQLGGTVVLVAVRVFVVKFASSEISTLEAHREQSSETLGDATCTVSMDHTLPGRADSKEPMESAVDLEHIVCSLVNSGGLLQLSNLCIVPGLYAYRLSIEVTVLSAAGNLRDATLMATIAALSGSALPEAVVQEDTVVIDTGTLCSSSVPMPCALCSP